MISSVDQYFAEQEVRLQQVREARELYASGKHLGENPEPKPKAVSRRKISPITLAARENGIKKSTLVRRYYNWLRRGKPADRALTLAIVGNPPCKPRAYAVDHPWRQA